MGSTWELGAIWKMNLFFDLGLEMGLFNMHFNMRIAVMRDPAASLCAHLVVVDLCSIKQYQATPQWPKNEIETET